ncbi:Golgi integral membrane protein 4-like isoform X4 [Carcharodon carcharias]|uniref:Golgi integral membrane protein 4-like isoform X4 n=1 Tax=Carcharodon carcharias TaxID=13397 RepID=UPI001B7DE981|nr:Golgi integral membrane protein 4-like isoform X4 [Carcharodon carcharias]
MGNGMCSRRQKGLLQTGFGVLLVLCFGFGFYTYTHLKENLRGAEMLAQKYKQQQESVSAQLQDFLVYKLEAQESLNKEKQDAMNRYGALSSQHKILKNQHDEIKKQLLDLQLQHNNLRLEHRKAAETHNQHYLQLHQQKDLEIGTLQDNISKLKHESKQLRRAHQDMHHQLAEAQAQVEEFRQLKEALHAMPSFKQPGLNPAILQEQNQARHEHPWGPDNNRSQVTEWKEQPPLGVGVGERSLSPQHNRETEMKDAPVKGHANEPLQGLGNAPVWDSNDPGHLQNEGANRMLRFTRTVNSLQPDRQDTKVTADGVDHIEGVTVEQGHIMLEGGPADRQQEPLPTDEQKSESRPISHQMKVKRWDEIVNDVNTGTDFKLRSRTEQVQIPFVQNHRELQTTAPHVTRRQWSPGHLNANWRVDRAHDVRGEPEEEEEQDERMDNELDEVDKNDPGKLLMHAMSSRNKLIAQEPLIPDIDPDPAQDPNNQGEDEFEEAELERPGFAGKVAGLKEQQLLIKLAPKGVNVASKEGDEAMDEYEEDQEAENEDNGGEMEDDHEDSDLIHQDVNVDDAGLADDEGNKGEDY